MSTQLSAAWKMSNEANLYLLSQIDESHLADRYASRTRTVGAQFAHIHNVRLRWLAASAPALAKQAEPFPKGAEPSRAKLREALERSGALIAQFLDESEAAGKIKNWKGPPATFLGYLVAHEAHHRGLAMVALRISGHKLPQEVVYGQWDWGKARSNRG